MINHPPPHQNIKTLTSYITLQLALLILPITMMYAATPNDSKESQNMAESITTAIGTPFPVVTPTPIPTIIGTGTPIPTIVVTRTPVPTIVPQDDQYEPNDSIQDAYDLRSQQDVWLDTIDGLGVANDDDYYRINIATAPADFTIDCQFTHADGDVDIKLVDESGNVLFFSSSANDDELIEDTITTAGDYYILVYNSNGGSLDSQYNLLWSATVQATPTPIPTIIGTRTPIPTIVATLTPVPTIIATGTPVPTPTVITTGTPIPTMVPQDDNYEPNNSFLDAFDLSSQQNVWLDTIDGLGVSYDDDIYRINIPTAPVDVIIDCRFSHADSNLDISLYNGTYFVWASSLSETDNEYIRESIVTAGDYYIVVHNADGPSYDAHYNLLWNSVGDSTPTPTQTATPTPTVTPTATQTPDPLKHLLGNGDDPNSDVNGDGFISIADYIYFTFE